MKWIIISVILWVFLACVALYYLNQQSDSNVLKNQISGKELVIKHRDKHISILEDSLRVLLIRDSVHHNLSERAKRQADVYRQRYEAVRSLRVSKDIDTLRIVIQKCDSAVIDQDSLILVLTNENSGLRSLVTTGDQLIDSLKIQLKDVVQVKVMTAEELRKSKRKETWRKILRTARDVGIAIGAFILGKIL